MKKVTFISVAAIALATMAAVASCSDNDSLRPETSRTPVRFTGGIGTQPSAPDTRAAGATWSSGDAIGIFMLSHDTDAIIDDADNKQFVTSGNGHFSRALGNDIYYPVSGSLVDFIAYYPYRPDATLTGSFAVNTADQSRQTDFDLLWVKANRSGKGYNKEILGDVPLAFNHRLARIVLNCKADANTGFTDLKGLTVTLRGMNTCISYSLADGTAGTPSTVADISARPITAADGYMASFDAIIVPAAYAAGQVTIEFRKDGCPFTWEVGNIRLEAGSSYVYEVILSLVEVQVQGTIIPWDTKAEETVKAS